MITSISKCSSPDTDSAQTQLQLTASELRIPPHEPEESLATFQIKDGFRIEQVAAEPSVVDPVAMAFDADGRLYVVEMRWYPIIDTTEQKIGRVRLLEDTTGDGYFDKSTVFAEDLRWPTAIYCYEGGIFVAATPDLLYIKDTDGDNVADTRDVIMSGFGTEGNPAFFVQQMPNSFRWGLDNRIYGVTSGSGGVMRASTSSDGAIHLRGDDFSFDPRTLELSKESGGLQHGMSFDSWGRKYINRQSSHIEQVMYEERYERRNPAALFPNDHASIAEDHSPAAKVFRISKKEPWRQLRTRWWVEGRLVRDENDDLALQAPGGQRQTMSPDARGYTGGVYITAASGITVYKGDAWPERYRHSSFIGDGAHNLVHRDSLYANPHGPGMRAKRSFDEQEQEFLASTDNWFRPVQFANGPDGALYMADLYREVFDLPSGIPAPLQQKLDLRSGNDRGRIYRIVPEEFEQPRVPRLSTFSTHELVNTLDHANVWHRETAARLLYEKQDPRSIRLLDSLFAHTRSSLGRLHAMYALAGQDGLSSEHVIDGLRDSNPNVRRHALRLAETFFDGEYTGAEQELEEEVLNLSNDPDPEVRYQAAFTLGAINHPRKIEALTTILDEDREGKWIHTAILSALATGGGEMFEAVLTAEDLRRSAGGLNFLNKLAQMLGTQNDPDVARSVLANAVEVPHDSTMFSLLISLGNGLDRAGSSLEQVSSPDLHRALERAAEIAQDTGEDASLRTRAIRLTGLRPQEQGKPILLSLLRESETQAINLAAIESLERYEGEDVARSLLGKWPGLTPRVRQGVVRFMLARPERITVLLDAIENERIARASLTSSDVRFLHFHSDSLVQRRSRKLLEWGSSDRQKIIDTYSPAVALQGNPSDGAEIFRQKCAKCHRAGTEGHALGPDLGSLTSSKSKLLVDIIDPSRNVEPGTRLYTIVTENGESLQGLIANETANSITLRRPFGSDADMLRSNIASLKTTERSLMPNGLEKGLSNQDMADLLEFIRTSDR